MDMTKIIYGEGVFSVDEILAIKRYTSLHKLDTDRVYKKGDMVEIYHITDSQLFADWHGDAGFDMVSVSLDELVDAE